MEHGADVLIVYMTNPVGLYDFPTHLLARLCLRDRPQIFGRWSPTITLFTEQPTLTAKLHT
jgi:hypothetical protein